MAQRRDDGPEPDTGQQTAYLFTPNAARPDVDRTELRTPSPVPAEPAPVPPPPPFPPADDGWPPAPGQVLFGSYQVLSKLGQGGMGTVWLVRHLRLDTERALKLIDGVALDHRLQERFFREARVMAKFSNHRRAVQVHHADIDRAHGVAYIDMEYVAGRSIDRMMTAGVPLPPGWVGEVLDQLCDVLGEAHQLGIVHRDLSPSNLMLMDDRDDGSIRLKVLDFGIAKILSDEPADEAEALTERGGFIGKFPYASPEQINGLEIDGRSDLYSVGVILYEFLTGYRPFTGRKSDVVEGHCKRPPEPFLAKNPNVRVTAGIEQVVMRCLAKDPNDRYPDAAALAEAFRRALPPSERLAQRGPLTAERHALAPTERDTYLTAAMTGPALESSTLHPSKPAPVAVPGAGRKRALAAAGVAALALVAAVALWLGRGGGGTSGGTSGGTTPVQPRPDPAVEPQLRAWRLANYRPEWAGGADSGPGWPPALVREADGARFERADSGHYLPEGYQPAGPDRAPDLWPRTLVRDGDGAEFVRIVGDTFRMGRIDDEGAVDGKSNVPPHMVQVPGFYIQRHEVTNGELERFLKGQPEDGWPRPWMDHFRELAGKIGRDEARAFPARGVPWALAEEFARGRRGLLPTEAQWEFAARSGGKPWPCVWGLDNRPEPLAQLANIENLGPESTLVLRAGRGPRADATVDGVTEMTGNVREWCRDAYQPYTDELHPDHAPAPNARGQASLVVRGGSYLSTGEFRFTTARDAIPFGGLGQIEDVGFRLVLECPDAPPAARGD